MCVEVGADNQTSGATTACNPIYRTQSFVSHKTKLWLNAVDIAFCNQIHLWLVSSNQQSTILHANRRRSALSVERNAFTDRHIEQTRRDDQPCRHRHRAKPNQTTFDFRQIHLNPEQQVIHANRTKQKCFVLLSLTKVARRSVELKTFCRWLRKYNRTVYNPITSIFFYFTFRMKRRC